MAVPITTKSRADLKTYFKTGSRPSAAQFGELIDAMPNIKDDSLTKKNNSPLQLQAEQTGAATTLQKVVEFYSNFTDAVPVVDFSLKVPAPNAALGLSITVNGNAVIGLNKNRISVNAGIHFENQPLQWDRDLAQFGAFSEVLGNASILNEGGNYNALMILGRKLASGRRQVKLWDDLDIPNGNVSFGTITRQMLNLWNTEYGIGVQSATTYFRSFSHFGWHRGGVHSNTQLDPGAGGTRLMYLNSAGELAVSGAIHAQNSDMYFTKIDHNHTGTGNTVGFAAIENGANYSSLMILGRMLPTNRRAISLWDDARINGGFTVGERFTPSSGTGARGIIFPENPGGGAGDVAYIQYYVKAGESTRLDIANMNDVDDDIWIHAGGNVIINNAVTPSDKRLKENITPLAYGLAQIKKLLPVSYDWKNMTNRKKSIGLLAQDVETVINEAVFENKKDKDSTEFSLSYNSLIPVLINAIKELDQKLEEAQLKIAKLQVS